ncbi:MAG: hypothetical protein DWQ05_02140 [Calditrichaeota bacterium]|nr:MAG: hypothetical protein DWQ05_02140 [Calditrichota bacterium]
MTIYKGILLLVCCVFLVIACEKPAEETPAQKVDPIEKGLEIYTAKKCAFCHEDQEMLASGKVKDIARPVIATDTMFVQTHLKFVEASQMPTIKLTGEELHFVSLYITSLHRMKYQTATEEVADAVCPVCAALVQKSEALEEGLSFSFGGNTYYFECAECMYVFQQAPVAFKNK